ncbi:hypothetical protein HDU81_000767 [Chytriomyces hyalinus]|nr:hypothetical protein HDU81_000767 [Chytriomyces hyalinus]
MQARTAISGTITVLKVVKLPSPFDIITNTVVSLLQLCVDVIRNRADALDLAESVSTITVSIRNLQPGPATAEAQAFIKLIYEAQRYLNDLTQSNQKLGLKLWFSILNQVSTTRATRDKLIDLKERILRQASFLNLAVTVGVDNRLVGMDNRIDTLTGSMKTLTGSMEEVKVALARIGRRQENDSVPRRDRYVHAANMFNQVERDIDQRNVIPTTAAAAEFNSLQQLMAQVHTQFMKESSLSMQSWMLSDDDIIYDATVANEIGWGSHQLQHGNKLYFTSYKGKYFSHPVSVKVFHGSDQISFATIPFGAIERAISKDLDKWKKLSHLEFVHTLVGVSSKLSPPKVVSELCEVKIFDYVDKKPRELFRVLFQLICGIESIHNEGVIHRDLNPDHILITKIGNVAISDFGMSRQTDDRVTATFTQLPHLYSSNFHSPELLSGMRSKELTSAVDVWAFGMIAYMLLSGVEPFAGMDAVAVKNAVVYTKKIPTMPNLEVLEEKFGAELAPLWGMIVMCLVRDRDRRITSQALQRHFKDMYPVEITYQ